MAAVRRVCFFKNAGAAKLITRHANPLAHVGPIRATGNRLNGVAGKRATEVLFKTDFTNFTTALFAVTRLTPDNVANGLRFLLAIGYQMSIPKNQNRSRMLDAGTLAGGKADDRPQTLER